MTQTAPPVLLDPKDPAAWTRLPADELFSLPSHEVREAQRAAVVYRFETLRPSLPDYVASF